MTQISSKMILTLTEPSQAKFMYLIHNQEYKKMVKTPFGIIDCANHTYNIAGFFSDMELLEELPEFRRTDKITDIAELCKNCKHLKSAITLFNTSKVRNFNRAFYNCEFLEEIADLDFSSVFSYDEMLYGCKNLKRVVIKHTPDNFEPSRLAAPDSCEIILKN